LSDQGELPEVPRELAGEKGSDEEQGEVEEEDGS
jgi:hypothetical protein